tara:strand:+ start:3589 stop:4410 length:822 start_codon:yes stop_codon:yes gene_type:complete
MKLKHNKRRNTAFLFEALVRELTKAALRKDRAKERAVKDVLVEFFNKNTVLFQELSLYKNLYETKGASRGDAEKIISEVKRVYLSLNNSNVFDTQSQLVSQINKKVSTNVFTNFVSNYKTIASISQIFNQSTPIKKKIMLEKQIVSYMIQPATQTVNTKRLNSTELKVFSKKFNEAYGGLLEEQKELLSKYVGSFKDNGLELRYFLNEELGRLKEHIEASLLTKEIKEDTIMLNKMKEVVNVIDGFKEQYINEKILKKILKIQELVSEIQSNE